MARIAIYDVNSYVMNRLSGLLLPVGTIPPIIPIQDIPESSNYPASYIVYSVRTAPEPEQWWISTDDVNYIIWNKDLGPIQDVQTALTDLLRRMDDSAKDINDFLAAQNKNDFTFLSFRVIGTQLPSPSGSEGGILGQPFNFRYTYTINGGTV